MNPCRYEAVPCTGIGSMEFSACTRCPGPVDMDARSDRGDQRRHATKPAAPAKPAAPKEPRPEAKTQQRAAGAASGPRIVNVSGGTSLVLTVGLLVPPGTTALELMDLLRTVPSEGVIVA